MRLRSLSLAALTGVLLTVPLTAVMYVADKWLDLSFPPFDVFDWAARVLPGPIITFGIDLMIDTLMLVGVSVKDFAKTAEQMMAVMAFLVAGIVAAIVVFAFVERRDSGDGPRAGLILGVIFGVPIALITYTIGQSSVDQTVNFIWVMLLFLGWGMSAVWAGRRLLLAPSTVSLDDADVMEERSVQVVGRRQFLIRMGVATASVTVAGAGLGRVLAANEKRQLEAELAAMKDKMENAPPPMIELPNEDDPIKPVLGTRPEYTQVRDHYKVFIRSEPTRIDGATWTLPITGLVDNPLSLNLEYIMNSYEAQSQFVTLTCISNRVGGDLISTTYWTGASLQDILSDVKPQGNATHLDITCGDGFHETVALDLVASDPRVMLAYAWDGRPIPFDHGFPLRIWIPDLYGMKQPKWMTGIEVVGQEGYRDGYWVQRQWDKVARINAQSVIDTVAVDAVIENGDQKLVPVGGIAFAGARGISKVEVRVDGNDPWQEAELRSPLSETTWVIWRYEWPFAEGRHTFEVRCVEADGTPQREDKNPSRPSGATGVHKKEAFVDA